MRKEKLPELRPPKPHEIGENRQVSMSNALVRASHSLLLSEKRLIMLGVANTDQDKPIEGNYGWIVTIHASEYSRRFGVNIDTAYDQLRSASKKLFSRYVRGIWWNKPNCADGRYQTDEIYFRWISSATYLKDEGSVMLNFTPELVPHLIELKREFTKYKLKSTCLFESVYTWRLYELLLSYVSQQPHKEFTIHEFKLLMDTPPSLDTNFGLLRVNVIETAVKEINEKSDLKILEVKKDNKGNSVFFESFKTGKKITSIKFYFKKDEQLKIDLPKPSAKPKIYTKDDLDRNSALARPGETYEQALRRLNANKK